MIIKEKNLRKVKYFLFFIGWGRSGNSHIGAVLDNHPNIFIKNEFTPIQERFKTYDDILKIFCKKWKQGQEWGGFRKKTYDKQMGVPLVIGGKKGGYTSDLYLKNPKFVDYVVDEIIEIPSKWIHVQRNPYDNITTFVKKGKFKNPDDAIDIYFKQAEATRDIIKKRDSITVYLDKFCKDTEDQVIRLCNFFNLPVTKEYLSHCREMTWDETRNVRSKAKWWNKKRINKVKEEMKKFGFIKGGF